LYELEKLFVTITVAGQRYVLYRSYGEVLQCFDIALLIHTFHTLCDISFKC